MARKLYRSITKRMIGGVCGGVAEYFDIDTTIVRLVFVAIGLITALVPMAIFYLIAWIIVPAEAPGNA